MQQDGNVDYSTYSVEELLEAWETIDADAYPLNLQKLRDELATRNLVVQLPPETSPAGTKTGEPGSRAMWSARELIAQVVIGLCIGALVLAAMMR